jgi:hypothetical protein
MEINDESTKQISHLYHDNIDVDKAIELMRDQNVSSEVVKSIYNQLSAKIEKLMADRFHYYNVEVGINDDFDIYVWTSRYLLVYYNDLLYSAFHKIKIIDLFNDRSM